jgi:23S rRNA (cytidine1920-2'-O)/16S rRNA (cytidine1409-2'-O)-methyltransferase
MRLDIYLSTLAQIQSRNKAKELIQNNKIKINNTIVTKASFSVNDTMNIEILEEEFFVSRAAYKLKHFLSEHNILVKNKEALDIGSSTGGFTQILLNNDIKKVTCVDVGSNQLHEKIRDDKRLEVYEKTDIRDFAKNSSIQYELVTCDVSFISILNILKEIDSLASKEIIILYKPQYEVGQNIKRNSAGVVQDKNAIHLQRDNFIAQTVKLSWVLDCSSLSKVAGKEGNIEELFYFTKKTMSINYSDYIEH